MASDDKASHDSVNSYKTAVGRNIDSQDPTDEARVINRPQYEMADQGSMNSDYYAINRLPN